MTDKFYYKCVNCGKEYRADEVTYLCPACEKENTPELPPKGILKTLYSYEEIKKKYSSANLFKKLYENDFMDLMPLHNQENFSYLRVGKTPFYKVSNLDNNDLDFELFLKDDSQNPTYSYKDRASYLVSAVAKEKGIQKIIAASTGNAGSSLAGICASQGQDAVILVPAAAPKAKLTQILMYGAAIVPVDGTYDDAFDLSIEATKKYGWYNRNTAYNPMTIEGKKTVSFELYKQMNEISPDRVFVPVGDGCIIAGVYKGFEDLVKLGIIDKIPKIVAVQSEGSSNIVENLDKNELEFKPSKTVADSIAVDIPRNFYMAKRYLIENDGEGVKVSDKEILEASAILSRNTGVFSEPAAVAAFAGMLKYKEKNKLEEKSKNIVLLTGSGLKDLDAVQSIIQIPKAIKPTPEDLKAMLKH